MPGMTPHALYRCSSSGSVPRQLGSLAHCSFFKIIFSSEALHDSLRLAEVPSQWAQSVLCLPPTQHLSPCRSNCGFSYLWWWIPQGQDLSLVICVPRGWAESDTEQTLPSVLGAFQRTERTSKISGLRRNAFCQLFHWVSCPATQCVTKLKRPVTPLTS